MSTPVVFIAVAQDQGSWAAGLTELEAVLSVTHQFRGKRARHLHIIKVSNPTPEITNIRLVNGYFVTGSDSKQETYAKYKYMQSRGYVRIPL